MFFERTLDVNYKAFELVNKQKRDYLCDDKTHLRILFLSLSN